MKSNIHHTDAVCTLLVLTLILKIDVRNFPSVYNGKKNNGKLCLMRLLCRRRAEERQCSVQSIFLRKWKTQDTTNISFVYET
jgi:hypothetical protein